jgi:hypothetical protein
MSSPNMSTPNMSTKVVMSTHLHNVLVNWTNKYNCKQVITVVLKKYDSNMEFYAITYKWIYDKTQPTHHPFWGDFIMESSGETLYRNHKSDSLIKYLVMDDYELSKYSGPITPESYRINIIRSISNFLEV